MKKALTLVAIAIVAVVLSGCCGLCGGDKKGSCCGKDGKCCAPAEKAK